MQDIVKSEYEKFYALYQVNDFPKLHHIMALIATESQWDPQADSGYQRGLMQISESAVKTVNSIYGTSFTYDDMFDPARNVFVGIRYLRWLYRYFTGKLKYPPELQVPLSIMQYNWGVGNVVKWLRETRKSNDFIDEAVPAETKQHLLDWLFWSITYLS